MSNRTDAVNERLAKQEKPPTAARIIPPVDPEKDPLRCGYLTGVTQDGQAIFEVVGTDQDIIPLEGLHNFASKKLDANLDATSGGGWPYVAAQIQQLGQQVLKLTEILGDRFRDHAGNNEADDGKPHPSDNATMPGGE